MRSGSSGVAAALVCALALAGCTGSAKDGEGASSPAPEIVQDVHGTARTPAPDVPNSRKGGVIDVLTQLDFEHLDPAAANSGAELVADTQLLFRSLTGYIEDRRGGLRLVGDLATNTGVSSDGGRKWRYTLRRGVQFEDGTPITAGDIAYGVARGFSAIGDPGPVFLKRWLQPTGDYRGPYDGGAPTPPGVSTPDDRTIEFAFRDPHPDFPLAAAMPVTAPVPRAKDSGAAYDTSFVASGPYRLKPGSYHRDQSLVLVRNEHWDPATDPIRHQYPDEVHFAFDVPDTSQTLRLLADRGEDTSAIGLDNVPVALIGEVRDNAAVQSRIVQGETAFTSYLFINVRRVGDVAVRRALNYAFDRDAYVRARGGGRAGSPATTISSPTVPGYRRYDAYPAPPSGDPAKAGQLLAGKTVPPLTYCFPNTPTDERVANGVKAGLERAGLRIDLNAVDGSKYEATTGRPDNACDLIDGGWGMDYPDARTVFEPLFSEVRPSGNTNLSYLDDPKITAAIAALGAQPDRAQAARGYADLDKRLMTEQAPLIPAAYERYFALIGSKVGGAHLSPLYGQTSLVDLFVT